MSFFCTPEFAHLVTACNFKFLFFQNSCFSKVKLQSMVMPRNFSQELSSITELSILMDFALIGDKDKWHFQAFALNYCSRASSLSCLMWSLGLIKFPEMCSYSYREWCRLRNYRSPIYNALKKNNFMAPFSGWDSRRQFTFSHYVPRNSKYSF